MSPRGGAGDLLLGLPSLPGHMSEENTPATQSPFHWHLGRSQGQFRTQMVSLAAVSAATGEGIEIKIQQNPVRGGGFPGDLVSPSWGVYPLTLPCPSGLISPAGCALGVPTWLPTGGGGYHPHWIHRPPEPCLYVSWLTFCGLFWKTLWQEEGAFSIFPKGRSCRAPHLLGWA